MLRVDAQSFRTIGSFVYRNLERDERRGPHVVRRTVDILAARVTGLPSGVRGLVATSDLQGAAGTLGSPELPAHEACRHLEALADLGTIPPLRGMVAVLAGDFFAHLDLSKRGGAGDVVHVWTDFAQRFGAVVGVAGNHDRFGTDADHPVVTTAEARRHLPARAHLLDGEVQDFNGLRIGGVSGVIGPTHRPFRRDEADYIAALEDVLLLEPSVVVLHQGPSLAHPHSCIALREFCERATPALYIYGHDRIDDRARLESPALGVQFLNVCERVVVLLP